MSLPQNAALYVYTVDNPVLENGTSVLFCKTEYELKTNGNSAIRCVHANCVYMYVLWLTFPAYMSDKRGQEEAQRGIDRSAM